MVASGTAARTAAKACEGPGVDSERRAAPSCARRRFPRWSDCTAHRREHKVNADCATAGACEPGAPGGRGARSQEIGWHRFGRWSGVRRAPAARVGRCSSSKPRAEGARRAPRGRREDRGAGRLDEGAARAMRPERAGGARRSRAMPARAQVHGPGRGARGLAAALCVPHLHDGAARPCGRSRDAGGTGVKRQ